MVNVVPDRPLAAGDPCLELLRPASARNMCAAGSHVGKRNNRDQALRLSLAILGKRNHTRPLPAVRYTIRSRTPHLCSKPGIDSRLRPSIGAEPNEPASHSGCLVHVPHWSFHATLFALSCKARNDPREVLPQQRSAEQRQHATQRQRDRPSAANNLEVNVDKTWSQHARRFQLAMA